jgi:hypothetical protein
VKYWEVIADNLSKAGSSCGCVATVNREGAKDLGCDRRSRLEAFVIHTDEKLTGFMELESTVRAL